MKTVGISVILFVGLLLQVLQLLDLMNLSPGNVGYDYVYFLPRLLEGVLFFRAQGLSAPSYSSFFCAGFPYHADPQVMFYSLPQFLTLVTDPWSAVQIAAVFFLVSGGIAACFFSYRVLDFSKVVSVFVSISFAANGFFRSRLLIGHLTYHTFMILPLIAILLMDKRIRKRIAIPCIGLSSATVIHAGGNYNAPIIAISVLLCFLLCLSLKAPGLVSISQFILRSFLGAFTGLLLSASKLFAGWSFTSHHPRLMKFDTLSSVTEAASLIFSQLFIPGLAMPFEWGLWEFDSSISPLVGLGLVLSGILFLFRFFEVMKKKMQIDISQAVVSFIFVLLFVSLFCFSSGVLPGISYLDKIPVINQMRVNVRFTGAAILPLILLAAWGFNQLRVQRFSNFFLFLIIFSSLVPGELLRSQVTSYMSLSISQMKDFHYQLKTYALEDLKITSVSSPSDNDWYALKNWQTNPSCYSVLFSNPPTHRIIPGDVFQIRGNTFNFLNPSCYVYPEENDCYAGHRILISDQENLEFLLAHKNPSWKISKAQLIADWITQSALYLILVFMIFFGMKYVRDKRKLKRGVN
jgi:hypothetical protein